MTSFKKSPMVFHVITSIARGGAENHLIDLIRGQLLAGWTVKVAYLKSFGGHYWRQTLESMGVQALDLNLSSYGEIRPALTLRQLLIEFRPDIVHAHLPPAELYTRIALVGLPSVRLIISKHCDKSFLRNRSGGGLEQWCAGRASRVVGISESVSCYFRNRWPKKLSDQILTIHYGLDPRPYDEVVDHEVATLRTSWGVEEGELLVGTVARLNVQKALDVMLRGFAQAVGSAPPGCSLKLVLVGEGELESDLRRLAAELGIRDRVTFAGFRTDIPTVMRAFDVFALTSDFEGFGLVLLEAMSASRPILATGVSAIPEVVEDGVSGLLIPRRDPEAFARALRRLLDPRLRDTLGKAGRGRVMDSFQPSVMVRRTLDIYADVL